MLHETYSWNVHFFEERLENNCKGVITLKVVDKIVKFFLQKLEMYFHVQTVTSALSTGQSLLYTGYRVSAYAQGRECTVRYNTSMPLAGATL